RFRIGTRHIETARRMRAYHRSRAFAVQVEIADVELAHRAVEFLPRTGVHRARQSELGVVGDFEGVVEIARLDHNQHRAENFFLLQRRLRLNVGNHGGLNEISLAGTGIARAPGDQPSILLANLDVPENVVHRSFVDDSRHVGVQRGIAYGNPLDARFQLLKKLVVDALVDNGARASRTLLPLETESRTGYAFHGGVDIGIGIHHDRVFAAHFEHRALDPDLAWLLLRRGLVDMQSNFARAGEGDITNLRMCHQRIAKA